MGVWQGWGADGHSNSEVIWKPSLLGAHFSQMHRDDCIFSQLKRKLDEDPTGFPCRTHPPLSSQTFNIFPACLYLFPLVSLDECYGGSVLWFPQSQEVKHRMQTGWFPWGLESLSPSLIVSDVSRDTSWVSTSPLLLGGVLYNVWISELVAVFFVDKRSKMSELWTKIPWERETEKQNKWQRWRRKSSRNRNNCLETGGQMPSKPDRQTAVAERQHAPCCSWAVIISYLGTKPRQTNYYQYSTALRWRPK